METPMFISAAQNNTRKASLVLIVYISPVMVEAELLTQGCVYANEAESITNGRDLFPSVT